MQQNSMVGDFTCEASAKMRTRKQQPNDDAATRRKIACSKIPQMATLKTGHPQRADANTATEKATNKPKRKVTKMRAEKIIIVTAMLASAVPCVAGPFDSCCEGR
jgi:hypothetical protein